jgi:aspartate/methionine/tyrosine aminotransferase
VLLEEAHVNTVPGKALAQSTDAADNFIRFALVPSIERTEEACERIRRLEL